MSFEIHIEQLEAPGTSPPILTSVVIYEFQNSYTTAEVSMGRYQVTPLYMATAPYNKYRIILLISHAIDLR